LLGDTLIAGCVVNGFPNVAFNGSGCVAISTAKTTGETQV